MRIRISIAAVAACAAVAAPSFGAEQQGVTKDEIRIGTIQDLSGPLAAYGKTSRNGILLWADEVNEQGGINGRKIKVFVEDSGYDPKKGVLAAQKLAKGDKVFAAIGTLGTPVSMPAMPIFFEANVPHLFPITAARQMYEPLHRLKYSFAATYYDQMRSVVKYMVKQKPDGKWCAMYQDDDFGLEVLRGIEAGLKENGNRALVEKTSYKRGATDFSSQVQKMRGSGCDILALGTIIRETSGAINEAAKLNWKPQFVGSSAAYTHLIPVLSGANANGLIVAHTVPHPYLDDASQKVRFWANKYKTRFGEDPDVFAVYGYNLGQMTGDALSRAGQNLTTDSFIKAMDTMQWTDPLFGADKAVFTPTKHLGSDRSRLAEIRNGRWVTFTEYVGPQ